MSQTRVAVVGYGYGGSKHVRVLSRLPDVAVTVLDENADRIREAHTTYPAVSTAAPSRSMTATRRTRRSTPRIGWDVHYSLPCHRQPAFDVFGASLPVAQRAADRTLSLRMSPTLSADQVAPVCDVLRGAL